MEKQYNIYDMYIELQEKRINKTITDDEKNSLLNICTLFLNDLLSERPTVAKLDDAYVESMKEL